MTLKNSDLILNLHKKKRVEYSTFFDFVTFLLHCAYSGDPFISNLK